MSDLISRQDAIDAMIEDKIQTKIYITPTAERDFEVFNSACDRHAKMLKELPSAQSEQTKMIKEIREWLNSGNRGNADYFIVDKIEEIINKYE